jgi:hypothetical protein
MSEITTEYGTRVQVTGSRNFEDILLIDTALDLIELDHEGPFALYHGDAKGADVLCGGLAKRRGWKVQAVPAKWDEHGRAAGPIRNQLMLDVCKPNVMIICSNQLHNSKGTRDMAARMIDYLMLRPHDVDRFYILGCGKVVTLDVTMSTGTLKRKVQG